ncbi:MAG: Ig-like domain-containing protein [Thermoplasmata archaeon]
MNSDTFRLKVKLMKRTCTLFVATLLLSGAFAALVGFPPAARAVDFTPDPVTVSGATNSKYSISMSASDDGRIYVVWSEKFADNSDIMMSYSSNNGTTFLTPAIRVNLNRSGDQTGSQVATSGGNLYAVWEDDQMDGGDIILARSENGGMNFEEMHVSDYETGTQSTPSVAANGNSVAVAWKEERSDNTIRVWNSTNGNLVREFSGHQGAVRSAEYSPNGTYIASGSEDHYVKIWNANTGALVRNITEHEGSVTAVNWSADGKLLATGSFDNDVILFNTADFSVNRTLNMTNGTYNKNFVNAISFSPDGNLVAVAYNGRYDTGMSPPDGDPRHPFNVTVWNLSAPPSSNSWTRHRDIGGGHTGSVTDAAFSHNGTYLATGSKDSTVKVWDAATGAKLKDIALGPVHSVAWSPDDRYIAAGLGNGTIVLVNMTNTTDQAWLMGSHTGRVNSLDWSIAGKDIASGASDPIAKIWLNESGPNDKTPRLNISGHVNSVYSVDWSPDALSILTAGGNSGQYGMGEVQIFCAVSDDRGKNFSSPAMVADTCAGRRFGPRVGIDAAGAVSVVWYDWRVDKHIYFANSTDGGSSFGKNIGIDTQSDECTTPDIFVDDAGTVHTAWQYAVLGRGIRYANSTDNFAKSRIIATGNHTQMPRISGSPDGSSLWVSWRSQDKVTDPYHIKAALSCDGGVTFMAPESLNYSSTSMYGHDMFVDRHNQTFFAWELSRTIYHRTTTLSDEWPPTILSTSPKEGETEVSVFSYITIRFSEPMNKVSVESAFTWTDGTTTWDVGNCTANKGTWNDYGDTVYFQPKNEDRPRYQKSYSFKMAFTARDISGNLLGYNLTVHFTTSSDTDPPIIEHYPSQNTVSYDKPYNVMAVIRDQWGTVESARLYYQGVADASPATSVEMTLTGTDSYHAVIPAQQSLGMVYYYIWANDALGNAARNPVNYTNQSYLYNVSVVDGVKPEIRHNPVMEADVFRDIPIWATVEDEISLESVYINIRAIGAVGYARMPMEYNSTSDTYSYVISAQSTIGQVQYNITAIDSSGNFNTTILNHVQILDQIRPDINSVIPELLSNNTKVLVRANVTDDVGVGSVTLYFKAVGGDAWVSRPMTLVSGDLYEFTIPPQRRSGSIYFYVNATDTSGNLASTLLEQDRFEIEVVGVGPDNTLYYVLGVVLAALMVVLAYLLIKRFSGPDKSGIDAAEEPPDECDDPPEPDVPVPEEIDEAP